ncbi:hypothetical protein ABK040_003582 [Willaertia magna]
MTIHRLYPLQQQLLFLLFIFFIFHSYHHTVTVTVTALQIKTNSFTIYNGDTTTLTLQNIATDASTDTLITYLVKSISNANFQIDNQIVTTFTSDLINKNKVKLVHLPDQEKPNIVLLISDGKESIDNLQLNIQFTMFRRNSFGAPKPQINVQVDNSGISFFVKVYKLFNENILFDIGLSSKTLVNCNGGSTTLRNNFQLYFNADYYTIYKLGRSIKEHLNDIQNVKQTTNSQFIDATTNLFINYFIPTTFGDCFSVSYTKKHILQIGLTVTNTNNFQINFECTKVITNPINNCLEIDATIGCTNNNEMKSIKLNGPKRFKVLKNTFVKNYNATNYYSLTFQSEQQYDDYWGIYTLQLELNNNNLTSSLDFTLQYQVPYQSINQQLSFNTNAETYDSNLLMDIKYNYNTSDLMFVKVISDSNLITGKELSIYNLYLCCNANTNQMSMPIYDPNNNNFKGCTVNDASYMSFYTRLVQDSNPIKDINYNMKIYSLQPSGGNLQYAFSFSLNPLNDGRDKLCFLHIQSYLKSTDSDNVSQSAVLKDVVNVNGQIGGVNGVEDVSTYPISFRAFTVISPRDVKKDKSIVSGATTTVISVFSSGSGWILVWCSVLVSLLVAWLL